MGRKRKEGGPSDRAGRYANLTPEQKEKYFGEERNRRRREKYAQDAEYRSRIKDNNRENYQKNKDGYRVVKAVVDVKFKPPYTKRDVVDVTTSVTLYGKKIVKRSDFAEQLMITSGTLSRWIEKGFIPEPVLCPVSANNSVDDRRAYYSMEEVKSVFKVYVKHVENDSSTLTIRHTDTIDALNEAILTVREGWYA